MVWLPQRDQDLFMFVYVQINVQGWSEAMRVPLPKNLNFNIIKNYYSH